MYGSQALCLEHFKLHIHFPYRYLIIFFYYGIVGAPCGRSASKGMWQCMLDARYYELKCPSWTTQLDIHETQITGAFQLVFLVASFDYHAYVGSGHFLFLW